MSWYLDPMVTLVDNGFGYNYFKGGIVIESAVHTSGIVTVTVHFGVYNDGGPNSYYQESINAKVRDAMPDWTLVVPGNTWIDTYNVVNGASQTFTLSVADTATSANITVDWIYHNGYSGNTQVYTIYFDALVPTPTVTSGGSTENTATLNWLVGNGTGSISGTGHIFRGTSPSPTTSVFTTTSKSATFTDTGLAPNTTYYYRGRIENAQGVWGSYSSDVAVTTQPATHKKFYGSVSGVSKKTTKWLGSVNGLSKYITKIYGSENGVTKRIF